jgi:hypothetical protein
MVGDFDNQPFIYDPEHEHLHALSMSPLDYETATFTSVSNNGVAVGYAQRFGEFGSSVARCHRVPPRLGAISPFS